MNSAESEGFNAIEYGSTEEADSGLGQSSFLVTQSGKEISKEDGETDDEVVTNRPSFTPNQTLDPSLDYPMISGKFTLNCNAEDSNGIFKDPIEAKKDQKKKEKDKQDTKTKPPNIDVTTPSAPPQDKRKTCVSPFKCCFLQPPATTSNYESIEVIESSYPGTSANEDEEFKEPRLKLRLDMTPAASADVKRTEVKGGECDGPSKISVIVTPDESTEKPGTPPPTVSDGFVISNKVNDRLKHLDDETQKDKKNIARNKLYAAFKKQQNAKLTKETKPSGAGSIVEAAARKKGTEAKGRCYIPGCMCGRRVTSSSHTKSKYYNVDPPSDTHAAPGTPIHSTTASIEVANWELDLSGSRLFRGERTEFTKTSQYEDREDEDREVEIATNEMVSKDQVAGAPVRKFLDVPDNDKR